MLFDLEVLPAKEGDCLILHWEDSAGKPRIALIDGGPATVYANTLQQRLLELAKASAVKPLVIDLLMISHVDNDHIVGIKDFFNDMAGQLANNVAANQLPIHINRMWHNTFDNIIPDAGNAKFKKITASFTATATGQADPEAEELLAKELAKKGVPAHEAEHVAEDIQAVLAGHGESISVRDNHKFLRGKGVIRSRMNSPFASGQQDLPLIVGPRAEQNVDGLAVGIYAPLQPEIDALQKAHDEYVKKNGLDTPEAALAAYADKSVPNLSSLVALLGVEDPKTNARKTILFTGDARGDRLLEGLKAGGLKLPIKVDVLKVPHHGSDRNVEPDFFRQVFADTYVISADGKHGNPDRDTLKWIVESRKSTDKYQIVLTYPVAAIDKKRKEVFEQAQKKKAKPEKWSAAKHSLASFIKANGSKFKLVTGDGKRPVRLSI